MSDYNIDKIGYRIYECMNESSNLVKPEPFFDYFDALDTVINKMENEADKSKLFRIVEVDVYFGGREVKKNCETYSFDDLPRLKALAAPSTDF